jgi:transcriptional regulator with XRE-family HTH domain
MTALHSEENLRFVRALAEARRKAGLSQYDLADRLGVGQDFISKYERGRRRLDVIEFLRIARAIGIEPADILEPLAGQVGSFRGRR